jgi:hypothetical protein
MRAYAAVKKYITNIKLFYVNINVYTDDSALLNFYLFNIAAFQKYPGKYLDWNL